MHAVPAKFVLSDISAYF